jgi:hypothetical protein
LKRKEIQEEEAKLLGKSSGQTATKQTTSYKKGEQLQAFDD